MRISQRNEPADLDPATAGLPDDFFIIRALSEGLLAPDSGGPRAAAAERWEISPDRLTYTFHLWNEARWSDGEPVTAQDFVDSFRRVLSPSNAAPKAELFYPVKGAREYVEGKLHDFSDVGLRAPEAHTLVVTLSRPTPQFLDYAASGPWIPVNLRVVARWGRQWTRPEHYTGNGPYVLAAWRPNQQIVVTKNPLYRGAAGIRLSSIQFVRFDDRDSEERAYRAGEVDVTMEVPFTKLKVYARERPGELHRMPLAETRYLAFNTRRPPLDDPRVRQALSLAIDRSRIVDDVLQGGQAPAHRLLPPALAGEPQAAAAAYDRDAVRARQLLAAAGFPEGRRFPRLELSGWSNTPVLEAIQGMWKHTLGIGVSVAVREARVHVAGLRAGNYDIGFITEIPDTADPLPVLEGFAGDSPGNFSHWADARYDALVAQAAAAADPASRASLLREAEARLLDRCPIAPVYFNTKNWAMRPWVRGWREDPFWNRYYPGLWMELPSAPLPGNS